MKRGDGLTNAFFCIVDGLRIKFWLNDDDEMEARFAQVVMERTRRLRVMEENRRVCRRHSLSFEFRLGLEGKWASFDSGIRIAGIDNDIQIAISAARKQATARITATTTMDNSIKSA